MNERELLERLAVLVFDKGISGMVLLSLNNEIDWVNYYGFQPGKDHSHSIKSEWEIIEGELRTYLPAQPSPDATVQLELREDA